MKSQTIKSKPSFLSRLGWVVMTFLAMLVFLFASRYLTLNPDVFFSEQKLVYMAHTTMLILHIVGAMLAIIIGPFQFLEGMRKGRLLKIHRWLGRTPRRDGRHASLVRSLGRARNSQASPDPILHSFRSGH